MSITMGQLASKFSVASGKVGQVTDVQLRTLAQVGVGYVKTAIQDYHAVDTSTMLNSTVAERVNKTTFLIGPTVFYAPYVALGTKFMDARPFHIRAAKKLQGAINQGNLLGDLGL